MINSSNALSSRKPSEHLSSSMYISHTRQLV